MDGFSDGMKFVVDVLDTWNMTVMSVAKVFKHYSTYRFRDQYNATVKLPGQPFIALRINTSLYISNGVLKSQTIKIV